MPTPEERANAIARLRSLPDQLEAAVRGLTAEQLTTAFMPNEWTVAQNVHHVADAHMNVFVRFKLILLEDRPMLKPFDQNDWAETVDATGADISTSLGIIRGIHLRWADLMDTLDESDWSRAGNHPERGAITLDDLLDYYSEHGYLHIQQINDTLAARG